jgi:hypothetical protein
LDFDLVITRNRDLLQKIIASLFALAGMAEGAIAQVMPRRVYGALMLVLRPAESAVRRLIIIAARGLVLKSRASRPLPDALTARANTHFERIPAFSLFDPLKHFDLEDYDNSPEAALRRGFAGFHSGEEALLPPPRFFNMDELVNSESLCRRLNALNRALGDLPRQARRLARWQARRDIFLKRKGPYRPTRISPMRPGLAPGYRKRHLHEVDAVLSDCHYFAIEAGERADTS